MSSLTIRTALLSSSADIPLRTTSTEKVSSHILISPSAFCTWNVCVPPSWRCRRIESGPGRTPSCSRRSPPCPHPRTPRHLPEARREAVGRQTRETMAGRVVDEVRRLRAAGVRRPAGVQVLAPVRKGPRGTPALNAALRPVLNPSVSAGAGSSAARAAVGRSVRGPRGPSRTRASVSRAPRTAVQTGQRRSSLNASHPMANTTCGNSLPLVDGAGERRAHVASVPGPVLSAPHPVAVGALHDEPGPVDLDPAHIDPHRHAGRDDGALLPVAHALVAVVAAQRRRSRTDRAASVVFVLDRRKKPLMPCSERRARIPAAARPGGGPPPAAVHHPAPRPHGRGMGVPAPAPEGGARLQGGGRRAGAGGRPSEGTIVWVRLFWRDFSGIGGGVRARTDAIGGVSRRDSVQGEVQRPVRIVDATGCLRAAVIFPVA